MKNEINLNELEKAMIEKEVNTIAPNYNKNKISKEELSKIIYILSTETGLSIEDTTIGISLLFLQGAASTGAPITMSVQIGEKENSVFLTKRNLINAYQQVTGNLYIRRLAEALATLIGNYAAANGLSGELAYRINTRYKAETGKNLKAKEMAFCSSFSQSIPNLAEITSENLVKLLSEDYNSRFESKKPNTYPKEQNPGGKNKGKTKRNVRK